MARHAVPSRRILVTGVGGAPGLDLSRALQRHGVEVIAADCQPLAAGLYLDGVIPRVMPAAAAGDYAHHLLEVCRDLRPAAILPTVEAELPALIDLDGELRAMGVVTWLPPASAVRACADKAVFHEVMAAAGLPTPPTWLPHRIAEVPDGMPLVVKPRRGQGSVDVHRCATRRQAAVLCEVVDDPIVQQRLTGREFTADCLVDRAGRASVILRHRLVVKGGLAVAAATFHDEAVAGLVRAAVRAVGVVGLCCVQGFLTAGGPVLTEINARVGGAFPVSEAAGAYLIAQTLNGLFGRPVDHSRLRYRADVHLIKYVETAVVIDHPLPEHVPSPRVPSVAGARGGAA